VAIILAGLGLGLFGLLALVSRPAQAAVPARPAPPDPELLLRWLASNPLPSEIDEVATNLRAAGYPEAAEALEAAAARAREMPQPAGQPLPPPPPVGTPPPAMTEPPPPLSPGGGAGPAPAPSPAGLTDAERAQLAGLPPDVVAEVAEYAGRSTAGPQARGAVFAALAQVRARGTTLSPSEREQTAQLLTSQYGLTQLAAWLRSVPAATPEEAAPSSPPVATPAPVTAPPPTVASVPGQAIRTAAYSASGARAIAPRVALDVRSRGRSYNREQMAEFQRAAGIVADGIYGGEARGALIAFGVRDAPGALFRPTNTIAYRAPA